jgi:SAM-dependent methyltransferase
MSRLIVLDRAEELNDPTWREVASQGRPVRLKLLKPAPPFREGDIVRVAPGDVGRPCLREFLLFRSVEGFRLGPGHDGVARGGEVPIGRVTSLERQAATFSLESGILSYLPHRWISRAVDALELLRRLRHPFTPPLFLGSVEACLAGVRRKYDRPAEAHEDSRFTETGLQPIEREMVARYLRPGGRVLDIGCGAGREAIGLAREGFQVVGIDIAPRMVEAARVNAQREGLAVTFRVQGATDLDEPPGSFDGAYWTGSYQHVPGHAVRIETLRRIKQGLTPEGALILLVAYGEERGLVSRSRLVDLLRKALCLLPGGWRLSEPGDVYMRETSEASDPQAPCFYHVYSTAAEVRAEIEAAGFTTEEVSPCWWLCRRRPAPPTGISDSDSD